MILHNNTGDRDYFALAQPIARYWQLLHHYVSVNSNWVHPPGNPRGLAHKTCSGGRDLTFESCPGAGNSTRTGILWKMKVNLKKSSVDRIFTGENKKRAEFFTFLEVYMFSQWNFCWSMG